MKPFFFLSFFFLYLCRLEDNMTVEWLMYVNFHINMRSSSNCDKKLTRNADINLLRH